MIPVPFVIINVESGENCPVSGTHKSSHKQSTGKQESDSVETECRTYKKVVGDKSCVGPKKHGDLTSNKCILTRSMLNRKKK
jgi:hypothetical protein